MGHATWWAQKVCSDFNAVANPKVRLLFTQRLQPLLSVVSPLWGAGCNLPTGAEHRNHGYWGFLAQWNVQIITQLGHDSCVSFWQAYFLPITATNRLLSLIGRRFKLSNILLWLATMPGHDRGWSADCLHYDLRPKFRPDIHRQQKHELLRLSKWQLSLWHWY